ncbi:tripartite tricarboxylate transporter TctB family protein [Vreelandella populi]|uniref:Tripartite tricarboxylate transporter TctB family protein n=1 Tax=Vreelandella populi TaxID=2498858 RepID=A0A3S0YE20_9GAMM|nr:tripartite tricarboxylate transporter TctB family protein [Halomonas populi]RUR35678.1 tripartite tricarboxylate transporter TctB family protein [Halomonas populi]RUR47869.1 tripartite tricarboxylate transporter TctB family protein [Halomonas populi]
MSSSDLSNVKRIKDTLDVITGIVLLVVSLVLALYLVPNYIGEPSILQNPMMSPRWLPNIVSWLILAFSILLIIQGIIVPSDTENDERKIVKGPYRRFVIMLIALFVYVLFFESLGAILTGILATVLLFLAHPVRVWWAYGFAIAFPVGVTLLFVNVMNVPLPLMPF